MRIEITCNDCLYGMQHQHPGTVAQVHLCSAWHLTAGEAQELLQKARDDLREKKATASRPE